MRSLNLIVTLSLFTLACQPGITRLNQDYSLFQNGIAKGKIDRQAREASGMTYSIKNPGLLWVINDGGNDPELFLITESGEIKKQFRLNITNQDWEALSIIYDQDKHTSFLYIGDIGDNLGKKKEKKIYWFEEPEFFSSERVTDIHQMTIHMEQGMDMEAILVDPLSKDILLFSKREDSITMYKTKRLNTQNEFKLEEVCHLPFTYIVDIAISLNGEEILLKDYRNIFYWKRQKSQTVHQTLLTSPMVLPYRRERQGEAICFDREGLGYYTVSESGFLHRAQVFYYRRN